MVTTYNTKSFDVGKIKQQKGERIKTFTSLFRKHFTTSIPITYLPQ